MKESEYIRATNRTKISAALTILRDVMPDDTLNWGVKCDELSEAMSKLRKIEERLFSSIETEED